MNPTTNPALQRVETLSARIRAYARTHLPSHFGVVFGSFASNTWTDRSDVDMMVFAPHVTPDLAAALTDAFLAECAALGLPTQVQIPHAHSLLISFDALERAIQGAGLHRSPAGRLHVPERVESAAYYTSDEMLARFVFNAITTKSDLFTGDFARYGLFQKQAFLSLTALLMNINGLDRVSAALLTDLAIHDPGSHRQEGRFLGYKNLPALRFHLKAEFSRALFDLAAQNIVRQAGDEYLLVDRAWSGTRFPYAREVH